MDWENNQNEVAWGLHLGPAAYGMSSLDGSGWIFQVSGLNQWVRLVITPIC